MVVVVVHKLANQHRNVFELGRVWGLARDGGLSQLALTAQQGSKMGRRRGGAGTHWEEWVALDRLVTWCVGHFDLAFLCAATPWILFVCLFIYGVEPPPRSWSLDTPPALSDTVGH